MGHQIETETYDLDVDRQKVQEFRDNVANYTDWREGHSGGLPGNIKWMENTVFESYNDAWDYVDEESNKHNYLQIAVKYKDPHMLKHSSAYKAAKKKCDRG